MALHENFGKGNSDSTPNIAPNDVIMTPEKIAQEMISLYDLPEGTSILEPCRGEGAFYNNFPENCTKEWCEITQGRDFFQYEGKVDWIITNPPYSILEQFMLKSFEVADNVAFLVPLSKMVSSLRRIRAMLNYGNIVSIDIIGASACGFPFGFPACAIHLKRGYTGQTTIAEWRAKSDATSTSEQLILNRRKINFVLEGTVGSL